MLDTYRSVETPEGVELGIRVAGPVPRGLAWLIDLVIRFLGYTAIAAVLSALGALGQGLYLLVLFAGEWFYYVLFEVLNRGATPGKTLLGLEVLHDDGTPVGWAPSLIRNLLRFADFLPGFYGFGLASTLIAADFKRLGDLAAGTVVAYRHAADDLHGGRVPEVSPVAPASPLEVPEQRAVVAFAERCRDWSPQRARELADVLEPLTGARGEDGVHRLQGVANWILGRR